ncbi:MAG TPA: hypothetical protein VMH01_07450 [Puia sp.]|nr:hypothetical protein [Puia sp.]
MENQDLRIGITVIKPVMEAMTDISRVKDWWTTNVTGSSSHLHDIFTVRFGNTFSTMEITELIEGKKVIWKIIDTLLPLFNNPFVWKDTKIQWDISAVSGLTDITMTHVGLTPEVECYSDCEKGWNYYVGVSLFKLLTEGEGVPGSGIFSRIIFGDRKYEGLLFYKNDPLPDFPDGSVLIDVKETNGEHVVAAHAVNSFIKEKFNKEDIRGEHYMLVENKPLFGDMLPSEDIAKGFL